MPNHKSASSPTLAPEPDHVKRFYTSTNPFQAVLQLPAQIFFAITGFFGLAQYARQIVRVIPTKAARLSIKRRRGSGEAMEGSDEENIEEESSVGLGEWVDENVKSLRGVFRPTWWLPNGHLQTMYCVVGNFSKIDKVTYKRTYLRVPDGGTIGLDFTPTTYASMPEDTPTLVVCHGLTGGSHESYVRNIVAHVVKPKQEGGMGGRAVVVNFRGCAGVPVTSPQFYSAGTTLDLSLSLHYLRTHLPHSPLHGIGFSLGASVLSRYLGETSHSSLLSSGLVLAAPWDLPLMSRKLENHWFITPVYSRAMARNLLKLMQKHYKANPELFDDPSAATAEWMPHTKRLLKNGNATLKMVDEVMVSRFGGPQGVGLWPFEGADGYYEWASPNKYITRIKRPTLVINAFDDPIVDGTHLPLPEIHSSTHVYAAISGGGGHLGWFEGARASSRWVLKPVAEWLEAAYRDFGLAGGSGGAGGAGGAGGPAKGTGMEVVRDGEAGWEWVVEPAHQVIGVGEKEGGGKGRIGWRVLSEGEVVRGEEGEGVLQGL